MANLLPINFSAHMYKITFSKMYTTAIETFTPKYLWNSTLMIVAIPEKPLGKISDGFKNKLNPKANKKPPAITSKLSTKNERLLFLIIIS